MAEYTIKMADERGHVLEQMENGASEAEIRDRFAQQGYLVYSIKSQGPAVGRSGASPPAQGQAGPVCHLQPAVCDADPCRTADHSVAGTADQAAAQPVLPLGAAECARPGARRRVALGGVRGAERFSPRFTPPPCWQVRRAATWRRYSGATSRFSGWRSASARS